MKNAPCPHDNHRRPNKPFHRRDWQYWPQFYGLHIEHVITDDLPDGRPTLPLGDDESLWALVAPLPDGRTQWRLIHLQLNAAKQGDVCNSFDRYHDQIRHNDRRCLRRQSNVARKAQGSHSSRSRPLGLAQRISDKSTPRARIAAGAARIPGGTTQDLNQ